MRPASSPAGAACLASLPAGAVFLISLAAADAYLQMPAPIPIDLPSLLGLAVALVPATIFGGLLAFAPNLFGSLLMSTLAEQHPAARDPIAWTAAGALVGAGIALAWTGFDAEPPIGFALVLTSAVCARLCRGQFEWPAA